LFGNQKSMQHKLINNWWTDLKDGETGQIEMKNIIQFVYKQGKQVVIYSLIKGDENFAKDIAEFENEVSRMKKKLYAKTN